MRKYIMCFLLLLFACSNFNLSAQGYLEYHKKAAFAEGNIVNGNYQTAIDVYEDLFKHYDFCFPSDCYIAAQVAAYANEYEKCYSFLIKGMANGLSSNCVTINPHLKMWAKTVVGQKLNEETIDSLTIIFQSHISKEVKGNLDTLFSADQEMIRQNGNIYNGNWELKPSLKPFWDSLYNELRTIIFKYGYPAERIAGVRVISENRVACKNPKAYYILLHCVEVDEELKNELLKQIDIGNISPEIYGGIVDNNPSTPDFSQRKYFSIQTCNAEVSSKKCNAALVENIKTINKNRTSIGLCSYECQELKEISRTKYYQSLRKHKPITQAYFDFPPVHFQ